MNSIITNQHPNFTEIQIYQNVDEITNYLRSMNWKDGAVAGLLGNIESEGLFNPGQVEIGNSIPYSNDESYGYGLGLIQWTRPSSGRSPLPWLANIRGVSWWDSSLQLEMINHADDYNYTGGYWGWITTDRAPISFSQFKLLEDPEISAKYWLYGVERPADQSGEVGNYRARLAKKWYEYISGQSYNNVARTYSILQSYKKRKVKGCLVKLHIRLM